MDGAGVLKLLEGVTAALARDPALLRQVAAFLFANGLDAAARVGEAAKAEVRTLDDAARVLEGPK